MGDSDALMGFYMGPQSDAVLIKVLLITIEVILQPIQIDNQSRGIQIFYTHGLSFFSEVIG